jgi:carboxypeptidase Taq
MKRDIKILIERLRNIGYLSSINASLEWDQETYLPKKALDLRAVCISEMSGLIHNKFINLDAGGLLTKLHKSATSNKIKGKDKILILETWREYERARKLPEGFVRELSKTLSISREVWAKARKNNDFKAFLPSLQKIVKLMQRKAEYLGYKETPYDALIEEFEPGLTTTEVERTLNELKEFLIPFLKKVLALQSKVNGKKLRGKFPLQEQAEINEYIARTIGFDFEAGRLDVSTHPCTIGVHPHDCRITTRYKVDDVLHALGSTIHEVGHGMYEQGLPSEHFGTPLGQSISLGMHESQSRMWENQIGKSYEFWRHFYPHLQKKFPEPFKKVSLKDFHQILNRVEPSLIRTEADEVTYNLHIIIRFEIEKDMIEGKIKLRDLPDIWNAKYKQYIGVNVPNDSMGVLQDVHWSGGLIGYFPTYTLGNLYAAQFYKTMNNEIKNIPKLIEKGEFGPIKKWLRKNIHIKGKMHTASDLVKKITGEKLNSRYFQEYLIEKYGK